MKRRWPQAGIPYVLRGGQRFFERPEVREAVVLLRGAARSAADHDTDGPRRDRHRRAVRGRLHRASRRAARAPPATDGSRCARSSGSRRSSPRSIRGAGIEEFVAELAARADAQHAPPVEGVTLASLHSAKGLEWDAVFLVGLVDGTVPITPRDDAGAGRGGTTAALRRRSPAPAVTSGCPGRWRAPPAAGGRAGRRSSSTASDR